MAYPTVLFDDRGTALSYQIVDRTHAGISIEVTAAPGIVMLSDIGFDLYGSDLRAFTLAALTTLAHHAAGEERGRLAVARNIIRDLCEQPEECF